MACISIQNISLMEKCQKVKIVLNRMAIPMIPGNSEKHLHDTCARWYFNYDIVCGWKSESSVKEVNCLLISLKMIQHLRHEKVIMHFYNEVLYMFVFIMMFCTCLFL